MTLELLERQVAHLAAEVAYLREKLAVMEERLEDDRGQIHRLANRFNAVVLREERDRLREKKEKGVDKEV
jgi:hypothetical protein